MSPLPNVYENLIPVGEAREIDLEAWHQAVAQQAIQHPPRVKPAELELEPLS